MDWKKIGIGAGCVVGGIASGLGVVTLIGQYVADGDKCFIIRDKVTTSEFVIIKSLRGGLFGHAHELSSFCYLDNQWKEDYPELVKFVNEKETQKNPADKLSYMFVILNDLYHDHIGVYHVTKDKQIKLAYALDGDEPIAISKNKFDLSESGAGHVHGLTIVEDPNSKKFNFAAADNIMLSQ